MQKGIELVNKSNESNQHNGKQQIPTNKNKTSKQTKTNSLCKIKQNKLIKGHIYSNKKTLIFVALIRTKNKPLNLSANETYVQENARGKQRIQDGDRCLHLT